MTTTNLGVLLSMLLLTACAEAPVTPTPDASTISVRYENATTREVTTTITLVRPYGTETLLNATLPAGGAWSGEVARVDGERVRHRFTVEGRTHEHEYTQTAGSTACSFVYVDECRLHSQNALAPGRRRGRSRR